MKNLLKPNNLPVLTVALGGIGLILRRVLYAVAVDGKNLLLWGHPLEFALWLVIVAIVGLVLAGVWKQAGSGVYEENFGPSPVGALGAAALAVGVIVTALEDGLALSGLEKLRDLLGILSGIGLAAVAFCRWRGKKPFFLLHALVCIFFAIHMVSCYRGWSSNPQIQDYVFSLFACIGLMLFAYHQASFGVDAGKRRTLLGVGLLTAFACVVSLSGTDNTVLYLTGGIWIVTNLCRLHAGECAYETT